MTGVPPGMRVPCATWTGQHGFGPVMGVVSGHMRRLSCRSQAALRTHASEFTPQEISIFRGLTTSAEFRAETWADRQQGAY